MMFSPLWIDEEKCQKFLDYIAQVPAGVGREQGNVQRETFNDFTSHAGDVHRYAAIIEDQMTNEDETPLPDQEEPNDDIYD
ncbi:MAG TPA: hypothetical protein VGN86_17245 [Pyrinomonadaceae bacterium]|jgi:hypothetical protein|nr:hypothetical protein [Pyrinomonadaceae bacterium]